MSFERDVRQAAVKRFLQTVVAIDDKAWAGDPSAPSPSAPAQATVSTPANPSDGAQAGDDADGAGIALTDSRISAKRSSAAEAGSVDVKRLADGLADLGLTCAILRPAGAPEDHERMIRGHASRHRRA